jgi:hypothetical protein
MYSVTGQSLYTVPLVNESTENMEQLSDTKAVNVGIMTSFTHCSDTTVSEKQDDFSTVTVSAYEQQNLANEDVTLQRSYVRAVDMS